MSPPHPSPPTRPPRRELPAALRLVGFLLAVVAAFGVALAVGTQAGPVGVSAGSATTTPDDATDDGAGHGDGHAGEDAEGAPESVVAAPPGGLQVSQSGYALELARPVVAAGSGREVTFLVRGPDGAPLTDYALEHERRLHLIALRRDLTGYQHVHPELARNGTWRARLDLTAGTWRLFADFTPGAASSDVGPLTLGTDLTVTGRSGRLAGPGRGTRRVDVVDGYRVELTGPLTAGEEADLSFAVTRDGRPVEDLQPYLGARGHLVALREGDLAYLHVHPTDGEDATGNRVGFGATVPSVGGYRLYLEFRVDGVVRTATFAVRVDGTTAETAGHEQESHGEEDDAH